MKILITCGVVVVLLALMVTMVVARTHPRDRPFVSLAENPGLKLSITDQCLNHLAVQSIPLLERELLTTPIDDIEDKAGTPIGTIRYSLSDIKFNAVDIPKNPLIEVTDAGLHINAPRSRLRANLKWRYKKRSFPPVSDHGTADLDITLSTDVVIAITANPSDPKFGLNVAIAHFLVRIDNMSIKLHGGASWLYKLFIDLFSGKIKSSIQSALNKEVPPAINDAVSNLLKTIDLQPEIHKGVHMDFAFVLAQFAKSQHRLTLGSKASSTKTGTEPYNGSAMPMPDMSNMFDMVHVFVSDYVLNSAGWVYHKAGVLQSAITNKDLPPNFPQLETSLFKFFIPELYTKWPDMEMQIQVSTSEPPISQINPQEGCTMLVNADLGFDVILPDKSITNAFVLTSNLVINVKAGVAKGNILNGELSLKSMKMDVKSSNVGTINIGSLDKLLSGLINIVVIPYVNSIFQEGFPIPIVEGFELTNPRIFYGQTFIGVASNFTFNP